MSAAVRRTASRSLPDAAGQVIRDTVGGLVSGEPRGDVPQDRVLRREQAHAAVVPCGRSSTGLPVGLQIFAGRGEDGRVLDFAEAFETEWPDAFV